MGDSPPGRALTLESLPPLYPEPLDVGEPSEEVSELLAELEELADELEESPPDRPRPHGLVPTAWKPWSVQRMVLRSYALGLAVEFVIVAGRQSGKTEVAVHLLLMVALERPKSYSIILAPNYIIAQTAIDKITGRAAEIPGVVWREQKKRFHLPNGSVIQVLSADRPEKAGRGPTLDGLLLCDESAFLSVKARDATLGSLTAVRSPVKIYATTPKGKNWVYPEFVKPAPRKESYRFRSADSPYANLEEIAANRERMGAEMAAQEFDAVFVDSILLAFPEPERLFVEGLPPRRDERQGNAIGFDIAKHNDWTVLTRLNRWGEGEIVKRRRKAGEGNTFYSEILAMAKEELDRAHAVAVVDTENRTGPGEALADILEAEGYTVIRVPTGQEKVKARLVERAQVGYQRGEIKLRKNEHFDAAFREFQEFLCLQREGTLVNKYRCPEGQDQAGEDYHDDCVISVCLAYWGITEADEVPTKVNITNYVPQSPAPATPGPGGGGVGYRFRLPSR